MTVILATWEAEIRRITVQGQPGEKVSKIPFQSIAEHGGSWWLMPTTARSIK
jgi:hypothetical protein